MLLEINENFPVTLKLLFFILKVRLESWTSDKQIIALITQLGKDLEKVEAVHSRLYGLSIGKNQIYKS